MPTKTAHIEAATHLALKKLALAKGMGITAFINEILKKAIHEKD